MRVEDHNLARLTCRRQLTQVGEHIGVDPVDLRTGPLTRALGALEHHLVQVHRLHALRPGPSGVEGEAPRVAAQVQHRAAAAELPNPPAVVALIAEPAGLMPLARQNRVLDAGLLEPDLARSRGHRLGLERLAAAHRGGNGVHHRGPRLEADQLVLNDVSHTKVSPR